jgi:hypothetical protein
MKGLNHPEKKVVLAAGQEVALSLSLLLSHPLLSTSPGCVNVLLGDHYKMKTTLINNDIYDLHHRHLEEIKRNTKFPSHVLLSHHPMLLFTRTID